MGSAGAATGSRRRATGSVRAATGSRRRATGSVRAATGFRRRATGSRRRATGSVGAVTGSRRRATGSVRRATGCGRVVSGSARCVSGSARRVSGSTRPISGSARRVSGSANAALSRWPRSWGSEAPARCGYVGECAVGCAAARRCKWGAWIDPWKADWCCERAKVFGSWIIVRVRRRGGRVYRDRRVRRREWGSELGRYLEVGVRRAADQSPSRGASNCRCKRWTRQRAWLFVLQ